MNKKIIPCRVRDGYVEGSGVAAGAAGSGGDTLLQLEFGPMWEGLVRYVTFRDARKENPVTVILTTDMIERIVVPGKAECPGAGAQCAPLPNGEACPCREVLVYNVPIPAKAMAIAGQMGVVVQGYELTENGQRVQAATMTANAYYKILPADYADNVEDGSVTPTLSQQLQAQIEKIKTDIIGAADAANAKEVAQRAAQEAQAARDGAEVQARKAEKSAGEAAGSAGEARTAAADAKSAAGEAKSAQSLAQAAAEIARDLSGGDVATRKEAKGYVKAHNVDPLAHEGLFPRIGFVAGERVRDSWRPSYGLGGGGSKPPPYGAS